MVELMLSMPRALGSITRCKSKKKDPNLGNLSFSSKSFSCDFKEVKSLYLPTLDILSGLSGILTAKLSHF